MIYYGMILLSALLFSTEFLFTNNYRKENGSGLESVARLALYQGITGVVLMLIVNRFRFRSTWFSFLIACVYACIVLLYSYMSVKALDYANLSVYSMFSMLGGMLLPAVFGILFCREPFTVGKIACCVLIFASLYMVQTGGKELGGEGDNPGTSDKAGARGSDAERYSDQKNLDDCRDSMTAAEKKRVAMTGSAHAGEYYAGVFILNGSVGVLSKFHQMHTDLAADSGSFTILVRMICVTICLTFMFCKKYTFRISLRSLIYAAGGSCLNNLANLMLLVALLILPASVQYPLVTGGVIIFSTVVDRLSGDHVCRRNVLAAGIAFAAVCCMAL